MYSVIEDQKINQMPNSNKSLLHKYKCYIFIHFIVNYWGNFQNYVILIVVDTF